ncbi:MAG TPA: hypothetical protein VFS95_05130 [Telluria sp.]|nr:hypothetical protein [Telluria sp.]
MNSTTQIIIALDGMRPPPYLNLKTPFEVATGKFRKWAYWTASFLLVLMGALALWHQFVPLPAELKLTGQVLGLLAMIFPISAMVLEMLAMFFSMFSMNRILFRNFVAQIESDERHAETLNAFPEMELKRAKAALELKIARTRNKIGLFAGSPDKLAMFALAAVGWTVFTSFSGKFQETLVKGLAVTNLTDFFVIIVLALIVGLTLGAVSSHVHMQRYVYQLELVNLALANR